MNKSATLKILAGTVLAGSPFILPIQAAAANPVEECSKELLLSYFPESFVRETLKKFNVPQDKWDAIVKELNEKDKEVVKIVEDKASKVTPNPLKDPSQRQAAVKIFRETLTDVFSTTLKKNGVTDDNQIQQMLDDVQQQKAKRFAQCMEQQRSQQPGQPGQPGQAPNSSQGQPQAAANQQTPATQPKTAAPNAANTSNPSSDTDEDSDDNDDDL